MHSYRIFGKNIGISLNEEKHQDLLEILSLYPKTQDEIDIEISLVAKLNHYKKILCNPKIHCSFENGFVANFGNTKIMYVKEKNKLKIFLEEPLKTSLIRRFLDIEFGTIDEKIEQILHELVLIPMNYFFDDRALVHSSAFISPNGETILIGGTGGVGKTSLELYLCRKKNFTFVADDMCVIDSQGYVYPNLALPKIYAYNVVDDKKLKRKLLQKRGILDNLHWYLKLKLSGPNKVRRKVRIQEFYEKYSKSESKISKYYILVRGSKVSKLEKIKINKEMATNLTIKIIQSEYSNFNQHILWHEYNSLLADYEPIITLEKVFSKWNETLNLALKNIETFVVYVPENYEHKQFLKEFYKILNES
jgi:hypothetical protein